MTRAAIYARVSSAAQRDAHTIENQLRALPSFVAAQGWQLVDTYVDDGRSAKTGQLDRRDGFARLMADAELRRFDVVAVVDVDRLTRTDSIEERARILGPLQRLGIRIVTPSGGMLDLSTMLGELYVTFQALVAAEENRKRIARIKAGKQRAIAEGRKPAGPTPFGLAYDRATARWSIDEPAAAIVREIFRRLGNGESCVQIADDLVARDAKPAPRTGWTRAAVYRIVRKRTALGEWCVDKRQRQTIAVPAIVTEQQWQAAAEALLAYRRRGLVRTRHVYLLEGLAICDRCGAPIHVRSGVRQRTGRWQPPAYTCEARKRRQACSLPILGTAEVDDRVWATVAQSLAAPDLVEQIQRQIDGRAANRRGWRADVQSYESRIARLAKAESGVLARYRRGTVTEVALDRELAEIARERGTAQAQLEIARRGASSEPQERAADLAARLRDLAATSEPEARQRVVRAVLERGDAQIRPDGRIVLRLQIQPPQAAPSIALVKSAGYRTIHGASLRIRRIA